MDAGLFGGTFNPLHNGHMGIIQYVKAQYCLDKIFLYPSATPPHKPKKNLAPASDRLKMVKDCVKNISGFHASDIEVNRHGPSFTIDTIKAFKKAHGSDINFSLLVGSDAFFDINTWKNQDKIFQAVPIIVMLRGEKSTLGSIASFIDEQISKGYRLEGKTCFVHNQLKSIRICKVPRIDISSTMIRHRVKTRQPITDLVPDNVEALIKKKDLYQ